MFIRPILSPNGMCILSESANSKCCEKIEVFFSIPNEAYIISFKKYGSYTMVPEKVNNQNYYQSNFFNGIYGIWSVGKETKEWWLGYISKKGYRNGFAYIKLNTTGLCIEDTGWNWKYFIWQNSTWADAKQSLGVKCLN